MQNREYVTIMIDSLNKKKELLEILLNKTKAQAELVNGKDYSEVNWKQFDVFIEEKDNAINRIETLDDGFEQLYDRMKSEIDTNKDQYKNEIKTMQALIKELTDLGVSIQTTEERNRREIERIMTSSKLEIKQAKKSLKVSTSYFNSMYGANITPEPRQIDENK